MKKVKLKIDGMHCTSCAMNIDGELEDTKGVLEAETSYAKQLATVGFDPDQISVEQIIAKIKKIDTKYAATVLIEK
ncbi:MAG: heavy-metal-associated domain-containing protein [Candidatus Levybacteria bacterium]|nr:heavy-metal-associated domain-containing protein [Candidatus Levybacteria bacterium]